MLKKILLIGLPLVTPTIAYILIVYFSKRNQEAIEKGEILPPWRMWPWSRLILLGGAFSIVGFILFAKFDADGGSRDGNYVPARLENGEIIPGYFEENSSGESK